MKIRSLLKYVFWVRVNPTCYRAPGQNHNIIWVFGWWYDNLLYVFEFRYKVYSFLVELSLWMIPHRRKHISFANPDNSNSGHLITSSTALKTQKSTPYSVSMSPSCE